MVINCKGSYGKNNLKFYIFPVCNPDVVTTTSCKLNVAAANYRLFLYW